MCTPSADAPVTVSLALTLLTASLVVVCAGRPAAQVTGPPVQSCAADPATAYLPPRDEGQRRADFAAFRARLLQAVRARDITTVLAQVHADVRVSFGSDAGRDAFRALASGDGADAFWSEFGWILEHGGRFRTPDDFDAPYTFAFWPPAVDAFACMAVTGSGVRLRTRPSLDGGIITTVSYAIVEPVSDDPAPAGWRQIRLADGRVGFMAAQYVRSPLGRRALFGYDAGRWWLVAYVAGD